MQKNLINKNLKTRWLHEKGVAVASAVFLSLHHFQQFL